MEASDSVLPFRQTVSEGDVDWILCVELNSDPAFRSWAGAKVFGFEPRHIGAWRSVVHALGESDLVWCVTGPAGRRHMALIENKIGAPAQPEQHERYELRAEEYLREGHCDEFLTVLVAPRGYRSIDSESYQTRIDYEDILAWHHQRAEHRSTYLASLFQAAIEKRVNRPPPDPEISAFRRAIWELATREFPQIELREPNPTREYWVMQQYEGFWIKYKMLDVFGKFKRALVDIELPGAAGEIERLRREHGSSAAALGAKIVEAGKAAAIRCEVPAVSPPQFDEAAVRVALGRWSELLSWWRQRTAV